MKYVEIGPIREGEGEGTGEGEGPYEECLLHGSPLELMCSSLQGLTYI